MPERIAAADGEKIGFRTSSSELPHWAVDCIGLRSMISLHAASLGLAAPASAPAAPRAPPQQQWLPGAGRSPSYLDGSLPGDRGFDPYCLVALARTRTSVDSGPWAKLDRPTRMVMAQDWEARKKVAWMREAEIKHSRLAMMAAAGWPLSELADGPLSKLLGLPANLVAGGRAPSLLNGGLFDNLGFLGLVALGTAYLELNTLDNVEGLTPSGYLAGDLGFDPLGLGEGKMEHMAEAEIKHGRAAMLAVVGFAVQEAIYGTPVVQQTPQFFKPFFL